MQHPEASPAEVTAALRAMAVTGELVDIGSESANDMIFTNFTVSAPQVCACAFAWLHLKQAAGKQHFWRLLIGMSCLCEPFRQSSSRAAAAAMAAVAMQA